MCGINGILRLAPDAPPVEREELLRTRDAMRTRGPDGVGDWLSAGGEIGLAHRRLAIIDLSAAGLQPMQRDGEPHRIVFNGEIYNYRELRTELRGAGVEFRTGSDTEVILALYAREGPAMLRRLRGMFALALWDERSRTLLLARDPYGIKPLYYAAAGGVLRFASQVKALEAGGGFPVEVDPAGLAGFLLWGSVPEPLTFRRGVRSVPAGHFLRVADGRVGEAEPYRVLGPRAGEDAAVDVAAALEDSVRAHLVADVPVGLFLSAGLDSGLIAALASRSLEEPLTTLTLAFEDYEGTELDEAPLAAAVARALGTRHVERRIRRDEFLGLWPEALAAMDQPSIDGFNTFVVSRVAREQGFKVVLSGLGGDELFGSYSSFRDVPRWRRGGGWLAAVPGSRAWWPGLAARLAPDKPKLAGLAAYGTSLAGAYYLRRGLYLPGELADLLGEEPARAALRSYDPVLDANRSLDGAEAGWEAVHLLESTRYMRNQLLRDSDWASMAHSLELRVPLVDASLRDALARNRYEPARGLGKAALVRRVAPELPAALWRRPKSGFSIPVMEWLENSMGIDRARGLASRRLALLVLKGFGVDLRGPDVAVR